VSFSRAALDGPIAAAFAATLRGWRVRVWLAILVVVGVVCAFLPLFGVLGYELALVASVVSTLASVDLGAALTRRLQRSPSPPLAGAAPPLRLVAALAWRAAALAAAIALVPGIIAAVHGIWTTTCDWWFGVETYLAMPLLGAIIFAWFGVAIALVTGPRRVLGNAAPYLGVLALAVWGLWRFYAAPPVFTYNPIVGYFPGNMYDEDIALGTPMVWARLEAIAWVVGFLALGAARLDAPRFRVGAANVRPNGLRANAWITAGLALAGAVGLHLASGRLGHNIDADDISRELGGRVETAHFVIDYAKTPEIEADLPLIVADHEFRYAQIVARIGVEVDGKIHSYYFASSEQKAAAMGARAVEMAKPWRKEIYLDHRSFPHSSLRHEIAHVVAGEFGDPLFHVSSRSVAGVPVPVPGLIEGLAVAVDWPGGYDRSITPHQVMRVLQVMKQQPSVDDILSLRFFSFSSAASYSTAGSFLYFLLERYGAPPLRALYASGGDFAHAYGKSQSTLVGEWRVFLADVAIPPEAVEANRERYARGGLFDRPCPHATAERKERAFQLVAEGDRPGAIALMRVVCDDQPSEPRHQLDLATMLSVGDATELDEARRLWRRLAAPDGGPSTVRADAIQRLSTDAAIQGDWDTVWRLTLEGTALPVGDSARRGFLADFLVLGHVGPAALPLQMYFFGGGAGRARDLAALAAALEPTYALAHYLYGLRALDDDDHAVAARELTIALDLGLPHVLFTRNAARRLAGAAYRAKDPAGVERACVALASASGTEVDRLLATDWRERLAYEATGALPAPVAATSR
jgi:hypothetical protein